jgi:flavin reductase ActVB
MPMPDRADQQGTAGIEPAPGAEQLRGLFRDAMSRLAGGVVMVTCEVDGRPWGITATACCSASMAPPLILVSLASSTVGAAVIEASGRFGVSILGSQSLAIAHVGSRMGRPKFIDACCIDGKAARASATPMVRDAQAHIDCVVHQAHRAGDHMLFIGAVRAAALQRTDRPLVYCARAYHVLRALSDRPCTRYADGGFRAATEPDEQA